MKRLVLPILLMFWASVATAQAPGGVSSGLAFWLKADAGTSSSSNGAFLTSWNDQSGHGVNATQSDPSETYMPRFVTDIMNGNPAIEFNGGDKYFDINFSSLGTNYTIITVAERVDNGALRYVLGVQSLTPRGMHLGYASNTSLRLSEGAASCNSDAVVSGFDGDNETPCILMGEIPSSDSRTVTEIKNGITVSATNNTTAVGPGLANGNIGRGFAAQGFSGYISEVIGYNRALNSTEKNQIFTYLSVKYGFTIDVAAHIYYNHAGFPHDIFGIGRNSAAQGLNQSASMSENSDGMVQFSNPSSLDNGDYLICGNDDGDLTFSEYPGLSCAISNMLERKWKVDKTGETGSISIRFDISDFAIAPEDIVLIIDQDGDGYDDEAPLAGSYEAPYLTFTNVTLADNAEFTLAEGTAVWYSRASGNTSDAIWSKTPAGDPTAISSFCSRVSLVIQAGHTITNNALVTARNFTIEPGASFVQGATNVVLHGTYLNSGSHTITTGNVSFNGTSSQTITGASVTEFHNVTCNNTSGVSVSGMGMKVKGVLSVNSGTFSTNGKLTLTSYSTTTGSIGPLTTGDVIGNVIVQRLHTAVEAGWVNICSPVSGRTVNDWNDDMITTGFAGSHYPSYSFNNVQYYDESAAGNRNQGYLGVNSIAENLVAGRGYFIYANPGVLALDVEGPIYKGNQSLPVTYTNTGNPTADGWCLVANPYPSAIDWDAEGWTKTNMANAVYVYDQATTQYASYIDGIGTHGGTGIIPSSQSFFVQAATTAPALIATETVKTSTPGTFKDLRSNDLLRLKMIWNGKTDETIIAWNDMGSASFDMYEDAFKIKSPVETAPTLCSISNDGVDLSINSFPGNKEEFIIPLRVESSAGGKTVLEWSGMTTPGGTSLILEDQMTGRRYDMSSQEKITVDLTAGSTDSRFRIVKMKAGMEETGGKEGVTGYLNAEGMILRFAYNEEHRFRITAYNMLGQLLVAPFESRYSNQTLVLSDPRYAMNALVDIMNMDTGERTTIRMTK